MNEEFSADFKELLSLVQRETQMDVTQYKESTLLRQTMKRLRALELTSLTEYLSLVRQQPEELTLLQQMFLISITSFFRDPEVFHALEQPLRAALIKKAPGDSIRVWVPGCATGEEVYSIAILLHTILGKRLEDYDLRLFGTDIDVEATELARTGLYQGASLEHVGTQQQGFFFQKDRDRFQIVKNIRERCVFSIHDVIRHPPFIRMDLISCRNLLIYLKPSFQEHLYHCFHYALNPNGILLLGKSESIGPSGELFEALHQQYKIFRRKPATARHLPRLYNKATMVSLNPASTGISTPSQTDTLIASASKVLNREYAPPSVLTTASMDVLHFFGDVQRFLRLPEEKADFSLFSLCIPEIQNELKTLCYRINHEGSSKVTGIPNDLVLGTETVRMQLSIRRHSLNGGIDDHTLLVSFEQLPLPVPAGSTSGADADPLPSRLEIAKLRQELADTQEHLQAVIEELQASNEELQSMNEEMQASSEELQSSNEELQSSNEELATLNDEMRTQGSELSSLNDALTGIQNSIPIGMVVVDREFHVVRFNALAVRVFGLLQEDLGRYLMSIPCYPSIPRLRDHLHHVVNTGEIITEPVQRDDYHFLMQISPLQKPAGKVTGAILTFTDISQLRQAEEALDQSRSLFKALHQNMLQGVVYQDAQGVILSMNPAAERILGKTMQDMQSPVIPNASTYSERHTIREDESLFPGLEHPSMLTLATGKPQMGVVMGVFNPREDRYRWIKIDAVPLFEAKGIKPVSVFTVFEDITEQREAQHRLLEANDKVRQQSKTFDDVLSSVRDYLYIFDPTGRFLFVNKMLLDLWGFPLEGVLGKTMRDLNYPESVEKTLLSNLQEVLATGKSVRSETCYTSPTGATGYFENILSPVFGNDGTIVSVAGTSRDVSERKASEKELFDSREYYRMLWELSPLALFINRNNLVDSLNPAVMSLLGATSADQLLGKPISDLFLPSYLPLLQRRIQLMKEGGVAPPVETQMVRLDGSLVHVEVTAFPFRDARGQGFQVILRNITEQKRAEEALRKSRAQLETAMSSMTDAVFISDLEGKFVDFNEAFATFHRFKSKEECGKKLSDYHLILEVFMDNGEPAPLDMWAVPRALRGETGSNVEYTLRLKTTGETWVGSYSFSPIRDALGAIVGSVVVGRDITERKREAERIQASLQEKEVLLKEIHHRVKNNLQIISSLVNLQADSLANPDLASQFQDIRDRVRSMALVHEKLYLSGNLARVDFADYISSLLNYLWRALSTLSANANLKTDLQAVFLSAESVIPCGLILNELLTNALKHAFPEGRSGEVQVSLSQDVNHHIQLTVRDDGIGFPANFDWQNSRSLGLRLIKMLTGQLGGTIEMQSAPGTAWSLRFPLPQPPLTMS